MPATVDDPRTTEPSVNTTQRQHAHSPTSGDASNRQQNPKLPHERDQSVDMTHGKPDTKVEQAYEDVQRGLQDTDRGPPAEKAYQKQKNPR